MMKNRFTFICPTFNAAATCEKTVMSWAGQSYENWRAIVLDDMSTDGTENSVRSVFERLNVSDKLTYVRNESKKWEVENVLQGLSLCDDEDIICRCDLDDYLCDLNALEIMNVVYSRSPQIDVVWSAHRWFDAGGITDTNISGPMAPGSDPYKHPWVSSHFKTFKKWLLNGVNEENYRGSDGEFFRRIGDQCFMLPALKRARQWAYVPIAMYAYRCDMDPSTFQTDDAKFQKAEAEHLRSRGFIE